MIRCVEKSLTQYVSQLAWLHSKSKGSDKKRIETISEPSLPPVGYGYHLTVLMFRFREVTFNEIKSRDEIALQADSNHKPLTLWESETMVGLKIRYENMYSDFNNTNKAAPYINVDHEEKVAAGTMSSFFTAMWAMSKDGSKKE